jgi:hypothetical protein
MMNLKVVEWKLEIKYVPARDDRATCYIAYIQYEIRFFLGEDCQSWIIVLLKKGLGPVSCHLLNVSRRGRCFSLSVFVPILVTMKR